MRYTMQMIEEEFGIILKQEDYNQADRRHGGAFDRGSADSYYHRGIAPHYYKGGTYTSEKVEQKDMTEYELDAYLRGYFWNEMWGDKKNY